MTKHTHSIGQRVGYVRVSSFGQNDQRQLEGVPVDRVFTDHASGSSTNRPGLTSLLAYVREGDTIVVHSMDRLARNLDDLRHLVQSLTASGIALEFTCERLTFTGDDSPMAMLLLSVMGAFAELERSLIRERQREGIELAKQRGVYKGGRRKLTQEQVQQMRDRVLQGSSKTLLARELGISRETLYQYLRRAHEV